MNYDFLKTFSFLALRSIRLCHKNQYPTEHCATCGRPRPDEIYNIVNWWSGELFEQCTDLGTARTSAAEHSTTPDTTNYAQNIMLIDGEDAYGKPVLEIFINGIKQRN